MAASSRTASARERCSTGRSRSRRSACAVLSLPAADYVVRGINGPISFHFEIGPVAFIAVAFVLGFFMSLGKAAVYKHIPVYYPQNVGAVGGLVGMIGGLGGFILPIAFGALNDLTGVWSSCFMLLFVVVAACFAWMHFAIRRMERNASASAPRLRPPGPQAPEPKRTRCAPSGGWRHASTAKQRRRRRTAA